MSDPAPQDAAPAVSPTSAIYRFLRKIVITLGMFFIVWIVFVQIIYPKFTGQQHPATLAPAEQPQAGPESAPVRGPVPHAPPPPQALEQRIDTLEQRLALIEQKADAPAPAAAPAPDSAAPQLKAELEASVRQAKEEAAAAATEARERIARLEATLSSLQMQVSQAQSSGTQLLTAMTALLSLKESVQRGEPYGAALNQLRQARPDIPSLLAPLAAHADSGVRTLPQLKTRFAALLPKALAASQTQEGTLARNLHAIIRVRKVGEAQKGSDDEAVLARAEARLANDDLEGALKEIAALSLPAAGVFTGWAADARAHLAAAQALTALQTAVAEEPPPASPVP